MKIEDLPEVNVFDPEFVRDPDAFVSEARETVGMARSARGVEVLTYAGAAELLRHEGFWAGAEEMLKLLQITDGPVYRGGTHLLPNLEGDIHRRQRIAAMPWFTPKRAALLRETVRSWIREWLDAAPGDGDIDLFNVVIRRLPSQLFCYIIGAPYDMWEEVATWSEDIVSLQSFDPNIRVRVERGFKNTEALVREIIEERRRKPGDDVVSTLLESEQDGRINDDDIVDVCITLLGGSTDTTSTQICLNIQTLAEHPEAWEALRKEPSAVSAAVLELMRFSPGMMSRNRLKFPTTTSFMDLEIPDGTMMFANIASANFDPAVYANPRQLNVFRKLEKPLLNFGHGRHLCVGRLTSLVEQEEVLSALLERWSALSVTNAEFKGEPFARVAHAFEVKVAS